MSKKLKQMLAAYGLVLPSFLTVMLVVAWPILTAIKTSFTDPDTGGFTFDNYKYFFETPRELTNILFTGDFKPGMMYHASGLVTMNMWFNIPFAALMITAGLGAIPDSMIESARDVGASKLRVLRSMILPLSMKDVVIAATFVFMSNVGSFTTPYLMGGNYPKMLGIVLFDQFNKYLRLTRHSPLLWQMSAKTFWFLSALTGISIIWLFACTTGLRPFEIPRSLCRRSVSV